MRGNFNSSLGVSEALSILGIEDTVLNAEVVKTAYKQNSLRTHPDKNRDNPSATEEFQRVSEAYNVLIKHLDKSSPSASPFSNFGHHHHHHHPGPCDYDNYSSDEDYYYFDEEEDEYDDMLDFYMHLFEHVMGNKGRTFNVGNNNPHRTRHVRKEQFESPEAYQEHLRRTREEQVAAQERRKQESIARKERAAREREQERLEAEERQKKKVEHKKAQAEAARKSSEDRAREILRKAQIIRSSVFSAARGGKSDIVRKGIWEEGIDAAGGEIKPGCAVFVKSPPVDLQETLLHIVTRNGDLGLVEWLDSHSADPEERNSQGLTPFHLALKHGHLSIVDYFMQAYPPKEKDSAPIYDCTPPNNLLSLALESREPEIVWKILDGKMASASEITQSLSWVQSDESGHALKGQNPTPSELEKSEDIVKLLVRYSSMTPTPKSSAKTPTSSPCGPKEPSKTSKAAQAPTHTEPQGISPKHNNYRGRGRSRGRGRGRGIHTHPAH